ncbi:MAG: T9SS type A sorting domain-containing protein [Bacteroidia bacterium]|nr:T9SS type A sorting domain-containing protein [Bacteroidia bacterium]
MNTTFYHRLFIMLLITISSGAFAQIKFRKKIGGNGYDYGMTAIQIENKGYVLCGSTSSYGYGNSDVFVVKTDSMGVPGPHTTFGGINIDRGNCIRKTNDNGYIITGYSNSFSGGGYDVYTVKTDSNFTQQWAKAYGGNDWDFGNCVEQTSDGGYIICGSTYSFGNGNEDYYIVKTDSNGDTLWTRIYGGSKQDIARSIIETSDGGYLVTGVTQSFGDTLGDFYTVKMDLNGDSLWTNKFGGVQADMAYDVLESINGYYIICGETKSLGAGDADGVIYQLSYTGITGINYTFGGASFDNFQSITERPDGKIAMTGKTTSFGFANGNGEVLLVALKSDWTFYNATTYGGYEKENAFSVETTEDNCFIICGQTNDTNNGLEDIYLIKTDTLGASTTTDVFAPTSIFENALTSSTIKLYPNPANQHTIIELTDNSNGELLMISNSLGQTVKQLSLKGISKGNVIITTDEFENGIYFIVIFNTDHALISTQKLIIQH